MKLSILDRSKKKKVIAAAGYSGLKKIEQLLVKGGRERIRAYSGSLSNEEIMDLWRLLPIEGIGLYVGKELVDRHGVREVRLSLDGLHTWRDQMTGNVVDLDSKQEESWFAGKNLEGPFESYNGSYVLVKSRESGDFIGTGKVGVDGKTLFNFLPKERRRKSQTI